LRGLTRTSSSRRGRAEFVHQRHGTRTRHVVMGARISGTGFS
jgi:hypothetical protein